MAIFCCPHALGLATSLPPYVKNPSAAHADELICRQAQKLHCIHRDGHYVAKNSPKINRHRSRIAAQLRVGETSAPATTKRASVAHAGVHVPPPLRR